MDKSLPLPAADQHVGLTKRMIVELVMFDVDGTLTQSSDLDNKAFVQALKDVFGFNSVSTDWGSSYTHVSDSGILQEICLTHRGNKPTLNETERFRTRLVQMLSNEAFACGGIKPVRNYIKCTFLPPHFPRIRRCLRRWFVGGFCPS